MQAHLGASKTLERVRLVWYWPGMAAHIRRTLQTCETCQMAKHGDRYAASGRRRLYAGRPWQKVAVDLVGPLPLTARRNRWVLVISV